MTAAAVLAVLFTLCAASALALVRAIRHAPDGYETEAGFSVGQLPSEPESVSDLPAPRPVRRPLGGGLLKPAVR